LTSAFLIFYFAVQRRAQFLLASGSLIVGGGGKGGGNTKLVQEIKESNKPLSCSGANLVCDQNSKAMMTLAGKAA